jgi:hypothetical protein
MKRKDYVKKSIALCFALSLILIQPAYAYIDPGTGSKLLQVVLAAIVTIGFTIKLFWHKLLKLLGICKNNRADKNDQHS